MIPARNEEATVGDMSLNSRFSFQTATRNADDNTPGVVFGDYGLLSFALNWRDIMGHKGVDADFWVNNALNRDYKVTVAAYYNSLGFVSAAYGEPRMFGVTLRYRFGQ